MEKSYGIGIHNRFDLYCDDDVEDPFEILKQKEAELQKRKSEKTLKEKSKPSAAKIPNVGVKPKREETATKVGIGVPLRLQEGGAKIGSKMEKSGSVVDRNKKNIENIAFPEGKWKEEPRRGRGGIVGGKALLRGRGAGDGFDQRGKREFDRQSGSNKSSVKPIEKRDGGGAHNWGTVKDDLQFAEIPDNEERSNDEALISTFESVSIDPMHLEKVKSDEALSMTLDEWKQKEQSKRSVPTYNLRKPGEGEDHSKKWGNVYVLKKKELEDEDEEDEFDDDESIRRGRQKQHVDIEIRFGELSTRARGRGRGFGRGSQGRSAVSTKTTQVDTTTNSVPQYPAPKVDDLNDFPSLSAT